MDSTPNLYTGNGDGSDTKGSKTDSQDALAQGNLIVVTDPQKNKGGMSSYVDYAVKTFLNKSSPTTVRRRYSHFFWLREALRRMFPGFPVPALPSKNKVFNFKKHKTERIRGLEMFVNAVLFDVHLACTPIFKAFITDTGDFSERQKSEDARIKELDPVVIITTRYPREVKFLSSYNAPAQSDPRAQDNADIANFQKFIKQLVKGLQRLLASSQQSNLKLRKTLEEVPNIIKLLEKLEEQEGKEPTRPAQYERYHIGPVLTNWIENLKSRPEAYVAVMHIFNRDLLCAVGMDDALSFRNTLAAQYKKAYKVYDKWNAKPPTNEAGETKRTQDQGKLKDLTAALDIIDKLIISYHAPRFFQDIRERSILGTKIFVEDQLSLSEKLVKFWHGIRGSMERSPSSRRSIF